MSHSVNKYHYFRRYFGNSDFRRKCLAFPAVIWYPAVSWSLW